MLGLALDICRFASSDKECVYDRHKEIIKRLKFITLIEQGERINVNTISTAPNNFFSSIYRSIFKESRQKTFQFLNETIDRSFELIFLYKESKKVSDRISCHQIVEDLMNSLIGIKHIQQTYSADRNFYCEMETLLGSIFARLAELHDNSHIPLTDTVRHRLQRLLAGEPIMHVLTSQSTLHPMLTGEAPESNTLRASAREEVKTSATPYGTPEMRGMVDNETPELNHL